MLKSDMYLSNRLAISDELMLEWGQMTDKGFMTPLNCPACGCGLGPKNGPIHFNERTFARNLISDEEIKKITGI